MPALLLWGPRSEKQSSRAATVNLFHLTVHTNESLQVCGTPKIFFAYLTKKKLVQFGFILSKQLLLCWPWSFFISQSTGEEAGAPD